MNLRWNETPVARQILLGFLLTLFLLVLVYVLVLLQPSISALELFARANSTRTSIALTSQALYGPFPTATGPTPTPSRTPAPTASPTVTPTRTPTRTPIRYFIDTATPRTLVPGSGLTSTAFAPTQPRATSTPIPPSNQTRQPTNPPRPTNPPPHVTNPPRPTNPARPTHEPRPTREPRPTKVPKPTKTPRR